MIGQMRRRALRIAEHVKIEQLPPSASFMLRPSAETEQSMFERDHGRVDEPRDVVPPIIDHHVEAVDCLHIVPPHGGINQQVAGLEFCNMRRSQRLAETRITVQVRTAQIDHAHDLAARRRLQRAGVEIVDLVRREECESPAADHVAGDVVGEIEVRARDRAIADPDPDAWGMKIERRQFRGKPILLAKAGKIEGDIG